MSAWKQALSVGMGMGIGLAACGGALASPILDDVDGGRGDAVAPDAATPSANARPEACVEALGKALTAHACSHAEGETAVDVVAGSTAADAPAVTKIHSVFRVVFRENDPPFDGYASYEAIHDDEYVFFSDGARDIEVLDGAVETHRQVVATCPSLTYARVYRLRAGRTYSVRLSGEKRTMLLYVEHGEAFEEPFATRCPGKHGG